MKYYSCANCGNNMIRNIKPNIPESGELIFCQKCHWLNHFNFYYNLASFAASFQQYGVQFVSNISLANAYNPQWSSAEYQQRNLVRNLLSQLGLEEQTK